MNKWMTKTTGACLHLLQNWDGGGTHPSLNAEFRDPPRRKFRPVTPLQTSPQQPYSEGSDQPRLSWGGELSACEVCSSDPSVETQASSLAAVLWGNEVFPHSSFPDSLWWTEILLAVLKELPCSSWISEAGQACLQYIHSSYWLSNCVSSHATITWSQRPAPVSPREATSDSDVDLFFWNPKADGAVAGLLVGGAQTVCASFNSLFWENWQKPKRGDQRELWDRRVSSTLSF